jgi:hypothetical protein
MRSEATPALVSLSLLRIRNMIRLTIIETRNDKDENVPSVLSDVCDLAGEVPFDAWRSLPRVATIVSDLALWWPGRCGSSFSSLEFIREGQKLDIVIDRVGRPRVVSFTGSSTSSGSSTMGVLVIQMEFDLEDRLLLDSATGGSGSFALTLSGSVSFLRENHIPEPFPWIFMVSFLFASIFPGEESKISPAPAF